MRKIALVETKSTHINVYSHVPIPRVGPILLATLAKQQGYEAKIYFEPKEPLDMGDILSADLVGISTLTMTAQRSYELADQCRAAGKKVVIGGIHATFLPEEALRHADFVLRGEAEDAFMELLQALEGKKDLSTIRDLSFWQDGKMVHNLSRPPENNLDKYPIPDWGLIAGSINHRYPIVSISTARGCPFNCSFCTVTVFNGALYRAHSVERVLAEIEFQRRQHPEMRYLFFADDIFNYNKKRAKDILRGMLASGLHKGIRWGAQMRHEAARDEELLELMWKSNCDRVYVGFESINQESLDLYGKKEKVEDVVQAISNFHREVVHWKLKKVFSVPLVPLRRKKRGRVRVHGMFMAGSDADTVQDVRDIVKFVKQHDLDTFQLMVTTPNPGSRDFCQFSSGQRLLLSDDWTDFDGHHVVHAPAKISPYELQQEVMRAMQKFYSFGAVIRSFLRRDLFNTGLRFVGWKHVRAWTRDRRNRAYIEKLKSIQFKVSKPKKAAETA